MEDCTKPVPKNWRKRNMSRWFSCHNFDKWLVSFLDVFHWIGRENLQERIQTWGRGWMTKASGVGERRKGRGELRRDCHHRVAALFVPTRMQQWYIDIWYITMIYMGEGAGGGPFAGKITWCPWGAPEYVLKQEDSSELTLAFVIMTIIANNDKM